MHSPDDDRTTDAAEESLESLFTRPGPGRDRVPPWLPPDFEQPVGADLPTGQRLRLLGAADAASCASAPGSGQPGCSYGVFDGPRPEGLGCVHIRPSRAPGVDADVSWWVAGELADSGTAAALARMVPSWLIGSWPFARIRVVGTGTPGVDSR